MAIETQPESAQAPGGGDPGATPKQRNFWLSPGIHTAVIGAIIGYIFGHWLGNFIGSQYQQVGTSDDNDFAIVLGFSFLILGWLIGLGVFNDLVRQMLGRPIRTRPQGPTGPAWPSTSGTPSTTRSSACSTWSAC